MSRHVRSTLVALATGTAVQRLLALLVTLLLCRHLGLTAFGEFAFGVQIAALVALAADGGIRLLTAREIARTPAQAVPILFASLRLRSRLAAGGAVALAAVAAALGDGFLLCCAGLVALAPFDQKQLADALGCAGREVRAEALASLVWLLGAVALAAAGVQALAAFAAAMLLSRSVYAASLWPWLRRLPRDGERVPARALLRQGSALGGAQLANELVFAADVVLLRALASAEAAALFAAAQRVVLAAEMPARVLARLVQPHLLHAAAHGDAAATLERALRASAHVILPIAAGGIVVAEPLLAAAFGFDFVAGASTLRWLLGASVVLCAASLYGNLLVARGRVRAYLGCLGLGMALNVALTLWWIGPFGAAGSAAASCVAMASASGLALAVLRGELAFALASPWLRPLAHAALVAVAAWAPALVLPSGTGALCIQLGAGAIAFGLGLATLELRGRWRTFGEGLARSSGFAGATEVPR